MIKRDQDGFIIQHDKSDFYYADGGDTCARTGIMARAGSQIDKDKMVEFIRTDGIVRHPRQPMWNDVKKTSRDNVVQYFFGKSAQTIFRHPAEFYAKKWFVNKDFLDPSIKLYLYKISGRRIPLWIKLLGYPWLMLSTIWNGLIVTGDEKNQFTCVVIVMGGFWARLFYRLHPDLKENIRAYWCGWRDQREVGDALITVLDATLESK